MLRYSDSIPDNISFEGLADSRFLNSSSSILRRFGQASPNSGRGASARAMDWIFSRQDGCGDHSGPAWSPAGSSSLAVRVVRIRPHGRQPARPVFLRPSSPQGSDLRSSKRIWIRFKLIRSKQGLPSGRAGGSFMREASTR